MHTGVLASAVAAELAVRTALQECQNATAELVATAKQARLRLDAQRQAGAHRRAFARLDEAVAVETQLAALARSPVEGLEAKTVARLADLETERARCQAILDAGAVHLDFVALTGAESRIVIDGKLISGRVKHQPAYCEARDTIARFKAEELEHCNFQLWLPDEDSEASLYLGDDNHGAALSDIPVVAGGTATLDYVFTECTANPHFDTLSAITLGHWPVLLTACRHHRLPVPPQLWRDLFASFVPPPHTQTASNADE